MRFQHCARVFAHVDTDAECSRHCVRGFVVMRRANAACAENVIVLTTQRVHGGDNFIRNVGDDTSLRDLHAERRQEFCNRLQVHVLRSAGEQFVSD